MITSFVYGDTPRGAKWVDVDESIQTLCKRALNTLNAFGIRHNDPRVPNFIVNVETIKPRAYILDFGFSQVSEKRLEYQESLSDAKYTTQQSTAVESIGHDHDHYQSPVDLQQRPDATSKSLVGITSSIFKWIKSPFQSYV